MSTTPETRPPPSAARRSAQPSRHRRARLPLVLGAAYGIVAGIALLAWLVVGDAWWLQPFNLTTFWWTLPAVGLLVPAALARRWDVFAWLLLPALAWAWIYGTAFLPPGDNGAPGTTGDLTVAAFNTLVSTPDVSHVVDLATATDADVLLLTEVFPARQDVLEQQFADDYPFTHTVQSDGVGGVMLLSRHPITQVEEVPPAIRGARAGFVATLDVDGTSVQVAPVHLRSPCPSCGESLPQRLGLEGRSRQVEVDAVLEVVDDDLPAIVGGDFNSTERSLPYRALTGAGFDDPQRVAGSGLGLTWPIRPGSSRAWFRIDWQLSRGLDPVAAWVGDGGPSDHAPVVATYDFEELR